MTYSTADEMFSTSDEEDSGFSRLENSYLRLGFKCTTMILFYSLRLTVISPNMLKK